MMAHTFEQSVLKGIHAVAVGRRKKSSCMKIDKIEGEVQILPCCINWAS